MTFTITELETLLMALDFWMDNVRQEDTDEQTFLRAAALLKRMVDRLA